MMESARSRWSPVSMANLAVILSCLFMLTPSLGQTDLKEDVEEATEKLAMTFEEIRTRVLGVDELSAEYQKAGFTYSELNISNAFANPLLSDRINAVFDLFSGISASGSAGSNIEDCCTQSTSLEACCHGCSSLSPDESSLLSTISETFSSTYSSLSSNLMGLELEFGHVSGALLKYPSPQAPADCVAQDARLQPWYVDFTRNRSREVVLLVDVLNSAEQDGLTETLRQAATAVLNSLTAQDQAQAIVFAEDVRDGAVLLNRNIVPLCPAYTSMLEQFIMTAAPKASAGGVGEYQDAFTTAFNLFSDDPNSDKLILFFTSASNFFISIGDSFDATISNVSNLNSATGNSVVISAYIVDRSGDNFQNIQRRITPLVNQPRQGTITDLSTDGNLNKDVSNYYSVFDTSTTRTMTVGRAENSNGVSSLSIAVPLVNGSDLIGVFHAALPWKPLLSPTSQELSGRDDSYFFVVTQEGNVLSHPLLPGNFQPDVSVGSIEVEELQTHLANGDPSFDVTTNKTVLIPVAVREAEGNSFISRSLEVTYHCRNLQVEEVTLYGCLVVASKDRFTAQQQSGLTPDSVYSSDQSREPLYHSTQMAEKDQCFYFCSISTRDRLSLQLTTPNQPDDADLQQITDYIKGHTTSEPSWAEEGVASEVAVASVVTETWLSNDTTVDEYVVRRHLATPSGIYLTHPFVNLVSTFVPQYTEWYILSTAHPNVITLTPPRLDSLREGGHVVSAAFTLTTPVTVGEGPADGEVQAVVAADLTLASLRVLLEEALPGCTSGSARSRNCFLLDDQGNFLYQNDLLNPEFHDLLTEPIFFANSTSLTNHFAFRDILIELLNSKLASKERCIDYLDGDVRQRLFISFDLSSNASYAGSDTCVDFAIRNIPGTNAFLGIVQERCSRRPICFCTHSCQSCDSDLPGGCECPCACPEDCTTPFSYQACPPITFGRDNLDRGSSVTIGDGESLPPYCSNQTCGCKTDSEECEASRDCHWCSNQEFCRHVSECCNRGTGTPSCCGKTPFDVLPECMGNVCFKDLDPPNRQCYPPEPRVEDSSDDQTGPIVGGVIGGLLGVILIVVFVAFFVWHQFCRKGIEDDHKEENAFDFSKTKLNAKNPSYDEAEKTRLDENVGPSPQQAGGGDETTL